MAVFELLDQGVTQSTFNFSISQFFFQQAANVARTGVLPSGAGANLSVSQTTSASGSVQVQAGTCVIADASMSQGAHVMSSDSVMTLDVLGPNPATSLPRIDLVVMDGAAGSIRTVTGSPASVPTAPALPATSLLLAVLTIDANATSIPNAKITDGRVYSALRGAPLWLNNLTERAAVDASCLPGQPVWVISEQRTYTKNSDGWDDVLTSGLVSPVTGYSITSQSYTKRGGAVYVNLIVARTGATVTANASGNLNDSDGTCATITKAGFIPAQLAAGTWTVSSGGGLGNHGSLAVTTAGSVIMTDCNNNGVIANGANLNLSISYPAT